LIGYARCSTDKQDLAAQRQTLRGLGVSDDRVYLDHGMSGRNRKRPGLEQALAAVRGGDTLAVPKLDRLARSVPDARAIGDTLTAGGVRLSIGGTVYDPTDPMGKMFPASEPTSSSSSKPETTPSPTSPNCSPSAAPPSTVRSPEHARRRASGDRSDLRRGVLSAHARPHPDGVEMRVKRAKQVSPTPLGGECYCSQGKGAAKLASL
jgi:hypothetical protein